VKTVLDLPPRRIASCVRVFEYAPARALLRHLVALAFLLPNRISGPARRAEALARVAAAMRERCERLFVRLPEAVDANDLEDAALRGAVIELGNAIADDTGVAPPLERETMPCIIGDAPRDRLGALLASLAGEPLGSAAPWVFACELLGTEIVYRATSSNAPEEYRRILLERLSALADQSPQVFWRALVTGDEPALDDALQRLYGALRGAGSLALL
jgi:hypothetical protein